MTRTHEDDFYLKIIVVLSLVTAVAVGLVALQTGQTPLQAVTPAQLVHPPDEPGTALPAGQGSVSSRLVTCVREERASDGGGTGELSGGWSPDSSRGRGLQRSPRPGEAKWREKLPARNVGKLVKRS